MSGAAVTPSGVREGDLAALTALCAVRGPSVLAYCRQVAGAAAAGQAAAEAFASFRLAVVQADDTAGLNPEALLISATRRAAAARSDRQAQGVCAQVPTLLAARAERDLELGDAELLEQHLTTCWSCRAPLARFKAAERAYRDPPDATIDADVAAQIVAALAGAVPDPEPTAMPPVNGNGHLPAQVDAAPVVDVAATHAFIVDQPTEAFRSPDVFDAPPPERRRATAPSPSRRSGAWSSLLGRLGLRPDGDALRLPPRIDEPVPEPERATREAAAGASRRPARRATTSRPRRSSRRPRLRLALVLPIALLLLALLVALTVSGVLGGRDPESSPAIAAPAAEPSDTSTPEIVVVPGARDATPNEVERAKSRERERARAERRRESALGSERDAQTGATPRSAAPPSTATPTPAPTPAPPANDDAARERNSDGGGARPEAADAGDDAPAPVVPPQESPNAPDLPPPPPGAPIP
ncbi:MAG: hypothetical protein Q8O56_09420 [Solirubrobacteraceae bacterium]|nr:hypothetical protein [Solirubrobacteraceae bacterium]